MKDIVTLSILIIKNKLKFLSESEKSQLKKFNKTHPISKDLDFRSIVERLTDYSTINEKTAWKSIIEKIEKKRKKSIFSIKMKPWLKYAAAFVGIVGLSYFFVDDFTSTEDFKQIVNEESITLETGDGNTKLITSGEKINILNSEGDVVVVQKGNKLLYSNEKKLEKVVYNVLKVPHGKRFQLVLSDGSKIHLNSGSSLKYPIKFIEGNKRLVFLRGEALFDVSEDKSHPFIVSTNNLDVRVFGTQFNVSSYREDSAINTVLVEGSVQVYNREDPQQKIMIIPGERASWDRSTQNISTSKVNIELYTAWIDGSLILNGFTFENILKKLERSYNVSIICNNKELNKEIFSARFNVDIESIENILDYINEIHPFTYTKSKNQFIIN